MEKNTLGEIIHHLRKKAGLTQEALADGICSPVSISRIENGKQMPSGKSFRTTPCTPWHKHLSALQYLL